MNREIKFRFHFSNAAPVVLTLGEIMWGDVIRNICYASRAGSITERCEYTGLEDKNGVEIYEDDLLRNEDGDVYRVWAEPGVWLIGDPNKKSDSYLTSFAVDDLEVIGNIYANPELLANQ